MKHTTLWMLLCVITITLMMSSCLENALVTSITVNSALNQTTLLIGDSLQMSLRIEPENAANKAVIWTVENSMGNSDRLIRAEITQNGVLTALSAGTVIVKATALDGSVVKGTKAISIIEPEYTLTIEASPTEGGTTIGSGEYVEGEVINISATANEGYRFVNFTKELVEISNQTTFTYTMPSENATLVANFEEAISFQCPVLEQAVRDADGYTGQPNGPIFKEDVLGITELSYSGSTSKSKSENDLLPRAKITSLEGIQHLANLEWLEFDDNSVSNVSPLANLINLEILYFYKNNVSNLTPLENLTNLEWLDFGNNNVSDLSPLENLTNLEGVYLKGNSISTLQPLIDNSGIGSGDEVDVRDNNLDLTVGSQNREEISILKNRGVIVYYLIR